MAAAIAKATGMDDAECMSRGFGWFHAGNAERRSPCDAETIALAVEYKVLVAM
jgi:hypothetical protein